MGALIVLKFTIKNKHVKYIKKNSKIFGKSMDGYSGTEWGKEDFVEVYTHSWLGYFEPVMMYISNDWIEDIHYLCYGDSDTRVGVNHPQKWYSVVKEIKECGYESDYYEGQERYRVKVDV